MIKKIIRSISNAVKILLFSLFVFLSVPMSLKLVYQIGGPDSLISLIILLPLIIGIVTVINMLFSWWVRIKKDTDTLIREIEEGESEEEEDD